MNGIQETLEELIQQGEKLVPQGGGVMTGYNGHLQSEYLAWRVQALSALNQVGAPVTQTLLEIKGDQRSQYFYSSSVQKILGGLKGALALVEKGSLSDSVVTTTPKLGQSERVFIVHGRDAGTKNLVARFLQSLGLTPVILHEQANHGLTIIEKFEQHADVGFAVVLLTPDDVGGPQTEEVALEPRARQNVIFELGYFIGRLGRDRVCAITKGGVDIPSDYSGVLYIPLDDLGEWMTALAKEIR